MAEERRSGPPPRKAASTSNTTVAIDHTAAHDKFRRLWSRRAKLDCGWCLDQCRCDYRENPTPKRIDGYRDAIEHLESLGLVPAALMPECRQMWTRGSAERELSSRTVRRWTA